MKPEPRHLFWHHPLVEGGGDFLQRMVLQSTPDDDPQTRTLLLQSSLETKQKKQNKKPNQETVGMGLNKKM